MVALTGGSSRLPFSQVVVFGGCSGEGELLGDAWLLDASAPWRWQPLQLGGTPPGPRHSAAAAATADGRVFIYGGLASRAPHGLDDLHCLARQPDGAWLSTRVALPAEGPATWPPPAFSATLTALPAPSGGCRLVMLGGCSTLNHTATYVLDTASCAWRKQPLAVHEPRSYAPVRHALRPAPTCTARNWMRKPVHTRNMLRCRTPFAICPPIPLSNSIISLRKSAIIDIAMIIILTVILTTCRNTIVTYINLYQYRYILDSQVAVG